MSTTLSFSPFHSDPVAIPNSNSNNNNNNNTDEEQAYKDMIKQLAAQAPEPYGAIPPLIKKKEKKKRKSKKRKVPIRRMSHVENWIAVDSKESIPDEEDLRHSSPFRNFLSTDFLVLPLHMPPPSLSATTEPMIILSPAPTVPKKKLLSSSTPTKASEDLRPVLYPVKKSPVQVIQINDDTDEDEEDEDEEGEEEEEEEDEDEDEEEDEEEEEDNKSILSKRSIPSFSQSQTPSTSTTKSYAMSSSPPHTEEPTRSRWLETIAQLRRSLTRSTLPRNEEEEEENDNSKKSILKTVSSSNNNKSKRSINNFIPMPLPPPKRNIRKRRSEATTQPRFNPETNTYTRDTRSNSDHLRMISAELNMMRSRKLSSPLKPRGFLPRRTDSFIRGDRRRLSLLHNEAI